MKDAKRISERGIGIGENEEYTKSVCLEHGREEEWHKMG